MVVVDEASVALPGQAVGGLVVDGVCLGVKLQLVEFVWRNVVVRDANCASSCGGHWDGGWHGWVGRVLVVWDEITADSHYEEPLTLLW